MPVATMMQITFPDAPPSVYLAAVRHLRKIEERVREVPALATFAADEGAPFDDDVAALISGSLATRVHRQASDAIDCGLAGVAPGITASPETARAVADRIDGWLAWLRVDVAHWPPSLPEVMGLGTPDARVLALARAMIYAIRKHLSEDVMLASRAG